MWGQRVNTRVQAAMKFENSEILPENSGGGLTLGSWDVCEESALASSSLIRRRASLRAVARSLYSARVGSPILGEGSG